MSAGTEWTHRSISGTIAPMPKLTDLELETVAFALRAYAVQQRKSAERVDNPQLSASTLKSAERAAALAERFEKARKRVSS